MELWEQWSVLLLCSIYDVDDNRFIINNDQNKIFSFTPGAQQFGIASSKVCLYMFFYLLGIYTLQGDELSGKHKRQGKSLLIWSIFAYELFFLAHLNQHGSRGKCQGIPFCQLANQPNLLLCSLPKWSKKKYIREVVLVRVLPGLHTVFYYYAIYHVFELYTDWCLSGKIVINFSIQRLKESKYSERTRCSLFGGLTNSLTTSMEVALNLPELPKDSYDMEATLPFNGRDLYNQEVYLPFILIELYK